MISRKIYNDGMLVVTTCSGTVAEDELVASAHWMIDHYGNELKPGFLQLFNALKADLVNINDDAIHRIAHINLNHGQNRAPFSMAIVASRPYPRALARLHKLLSAAVNIQVEIFSTDGDAYQWLGVDNPEHENI